MIQRFPFLFAFLALFLVGAAQAGLPLFDSEQQKLPTLAPLLKKVNPAVVNISVSQTRTASNPLLNDPFFRRFFNVPPGYQQPKRKTKAAGSGIILDAKSGTVITNHHVINGADEIQVSLNDGRSFTAELIGQDPEVDIAVLKIEADNLAALPLSDSDKLEVGDFVVAIGNPFGLGQTVTTGVVSALGRSGLGIEGYENFIQTDASINPGNSGGALVNLRGELVGINTAILAPSGGNIGIGFAIPINMAQSSIQQILEHGEVKRGQLGVFIQDLTPELAEAFDLDKNQQGVLITKVQEDASADKAGIEEGDIVIDVDGKAMTSAAKLRNAIGMQRVGEKVKVTILRDGVKKTLNIKIGSSQDQKSAKAIFEKLEGADLRDHQSGEGVVIANIQANSPAAYSGLRRGDIIIAANRQAVNSLEDLRKAVEQSKDKLLLRVNRGGAALFIVIR